MATQTRLIPHTFHLDNASRAAGKRGVAKARAALAEAREKAAAERRTQTGVDHATAA